MDDAMRRIEAPNPNEYHEFYQKYIDLVDADRLFEQLELQPQSLDQWLGELSNEQVSKRHEPYTWTLKQLVGHLIDGERVFCDRMMRIGVGDQTPIPGIDQQMFVNGIDYAKLSVQNLLEEFRCLRRASVLAANRLSDEALARTGIASDATVSSRASLFILVGHVEYHLMIIRKRLGVY